jgi:hypothetical protein
LKKIFSYGRRLSTIKISVPLCDPHFEAASFKGTAEKLVGKLAVIGGILAGLFFRNHIAAALGRDGKSPGKVICRRRLWFWHIYFGLVDYYFIGSSHVCRVRIQKGS